MNSYYWMGFPGLGTRDFHIDPTAITLGNLEIKWYGLIIVCGMIAAVVYTYLRARRHGLVFDDILDIALSAIIPGVIGARLYYVFFDWLEHPEKYSRFYDVIAIWEGGLAIYGGLIFGVIGAVITLKIKKISIPTLLDCAFPGVLLAQSIGRWGNFVNMEAYGSETTSFIRMRLMSESALRVTEVHPTFLYESVWNLVGFIALALLLKKRKFDGQIFLMSVAWYGLGRFFIEGLRSDSLYIGQFRVSQVLAGALFVIALGLLIYGFVYYRERNVKECIYAEGTKKYDDFMAKKEASAEEAVEAPVEEAAEAPAEEAVEAPVEEAAEAPAEEAVEAPVEEAAEAPVEEVVETPVEEVVEAPVEEVVEAPENSDATENN